MVVMTLTDTLKQVIEYLAEAQKKYTDRKIEDFVVDLGKTKDELKNLVAALDDLDFKEDGKVDAKVITAKVTELEAAVKTLQNNISNQGATVSADVNKEIEAIKADISDIKNNLIAKLTDRVNTIEEKLANMEIDINSLKAKVDEIYSNNSDNSSNSVKSDNSDNSSKSNDFSNLKPGLGS